MAVELSFKELLLQNLKLDDPWSPPKPWESIPSESGLVSHSSLTSSSTSGDSTYLPYSLSEESLVRLVMNALQGVESALISIQKLSASFCAVPADRSALSVPSLWNRSLSTSALGQLLKSIGYTGCLVFLLRKFVEYFTDLSFGGPVNPGDRMSCSQVNHAFAVAIGKILQGYSCGLNTLNVAARLRRDTGNTNEFSTDSSRIRCLKSTVHSGVTVLEVYLHSKELRTRIEALGNICNLCNAASCFTVTPIQDLISSEVVEFDNFPRGGNLLTYLYDQLQVADPVNYSLLKLLFLQSLEPYCDFVRSWIYEAKINDPHGEFIIKHDGTTPAYSHGIADVLDDIPLATVREQDGISIPCFLKNLIIPLLRAGQQLQVVMKLLDVCKYIAAGDYTFADVLPGYGCHMDYDFPCMSPLSFDKRNVELVVLSRKAFYRRMLEKLENALNNLEVKYQQGEIQDKIFLYASTSNGTVDAYSTAALISTVNFTSSVDPTNSDSVVTVQNADFEADGMSEDLEFDALESSECSSTDGYVEHNDPKPYTNRPEQIYLSTLRFSSDIMNDHSLGEVHQSQGYNSIKSDSLHSFHDKDLLFNFTDPFTQKIPSDHALHFERTSRSWLPEIQCAGDEFYFGGLIGSQIENLPQSCGFFGTGNGVTENVQKPEKTSINSQIQYAAEGFLQAQEYGRNKFVDYTQMCSDSYILQSWNDKYQNDVLSMNPILRKSPFYSTSFMDGDHDSAKISKGFNVFDFGCITDPFKLYAQRHTSGNVPHDGSQNSIASVQPVDGFHVMQDTGNNLRHKNYLLSTGSSLNSNRGGTDVLPVCASGGSASSLCGACHTSRRSTGNRTCDCDFMFEMPLEFVIDKCLLQEILLQYNYISRLTIQLLEKGFDLREHFLALRRYHFMDIADWADMFVTALWHHNWCFNEEMRTSEVQRLLKSSIERSSCERDAYKNRLYVYNKNHSSNPVSTSSVGAGVHSFNFVGLGYRVVWPVSIILTPNALRIYAEIFSFLVQVKLAALSLTDIWYSLKDFRYMDSRNSHHQVDLNHLNILMKLRHWVNHFISVLQQYLSSQLSDVSCCRFLHFKQEVKDMMDLESVHMSYLVATLRRCFLTDEMQPISSIIASILQCALDLRTCLVKGSGSVGGNMRSLGGSLPHINISQVVSIKEKFYKSMRELHTCCLNSPKHEQFGLSQFWNNLNYNEFYSGVAENRMSHDGLQEQ